MFLLNFKEQPYQPRCVKRTAADHTGCEWQEFNLHGEYPAKEACQGEYIGLECWHFSLF